MEYLVWEEPGRLVKRTADFRIDRIVPIETGQPDMAPTFPGITDAAGLRDWDPPFPIELRRVRPIDEEYWKKYSTTPKAFIPLQIGQALWKTRYGGLTSIRFSAKSPIATGTKEDLELKLRERLDPLRAGIAVQSVRSESLDASRGATNFGEYFVYFSFFLVVSALLLAGLFFKLNVEKRIREVGLLRAVGLPPSSVRTPLPQRRPLAVVQVRCWDRERLAICRSDNRCTAHVVDWRNWNGNITLHVAAFIDDRRRRRRSRRVVLHCANASRPQDHP
jgi:hypothetical protein